MSDRYEDARGVIQDWFGPLDSVTHITTKQGAVRGNHVHKLTEQWTLVLSGRLLMATGDTPGTCKLFEMGPMARVFHRPGEPHAWKALEDTDCLVFTRGPRAGDQYESDTYRLDEPLLT